MCVSCFCLMYFISSLNAWLIELNSSQYFTWAWPLAFYLSNNCFTIWSYYFHTWSWAATTCSHSPPLSATLCSFTHSFILECLQLRTCLWLYLNLITLLFHFQFSVHIYSFDSTPTFGRPSISLIWQYGYWAEVSLLMIDLEPICGL